MSRRAYQPSPVRTARGGWLRLSVRLCPQVRPSCSILRWLWTWLCKPMTRISAETARCSPRSCGEASSPVTKAALCSWTSARRPVWRRCIKPIPWLIAANTMLALSSADLASLLAEEVAQNPALELDERPLCPRCGQPLSGGSCPDCVSLVPSSQVTPADDWQAEASWSAGGSEEDAFDPLSLLGAPVDFRAQLCLALQAQLPSDDGPLLEYLVESLDDDGYLQCSVEEAAHLFRVPLERVEHVLADVAGPGPRWHWRPHGARVSAAAAPGVSRAGHPAALCLRDSGPVPALARSASIPGDRAGGGLHHPPGGAGAGLSPAPPASLPDAQRPGQHAAISPGPLLPDVRIQRQSEGPGYEVEVLEAHRFRVQLSPAYTAAAHTLGTCSGAERQQIQASLAQARLFVSNLKRRWQTLARITVYLVERQGAFVEQGQAALLPLTRAEVAGALELHASTVSRAMADKTVLLPSGQVVPFSTFCTANLRVKSVLQELVQQATRPLSDQRLAEQLQARGITIARRTVAKYRRHLGLPPAHARARAR